MVLPAGNLPNGPKFNGGALPTSDGDKEDDGYTGLKTTARWMANLTRLASGTVNSVWKDANGTLVAKLSDSGNTSAAENLKLINTNTTANAADDNFGVGNKVVNTWLGNIARVVGGSQTTNNVFYNATSAKTLAQQLSGSTASINDLGKIAGPTTFTQVSATGSVNANPCRLFAISVYVVGTVSAPLFSNGIAGAGFWQRPLANLVAGDIYAFPAGIYLSGGIYVVTMPTGGFYNFFYSV